MKATLSIGAHKFVPSGSALVDTLFNPGGTAHGIYSARKRSVIFKTPAGEPFACLVANPGQSKFFVSAGLQRDGRTFYSFGLSESAARALGIHELSYTAQADEAARAWQTVSASAFAPAT